MGKEKEKEKLKENNMIDQIRKEKGNVLKGLFKASLDLSKQFDVN